MKTTVDENGEFVSVPVEKEQKIRELVEKIRLYEDERKLLNETIKETKQQYIDDGVVTKEEMKLIAHAIRLAKDGVDIDWLSSVYDICLEEV